MSECLHKEIQEDFAYAMTSNMQLRLPSHSGKDCVNRKNLGRLKSGDSFLRTTEDGREYFAIKNQRHVEYWMNQIAPVMLVIRSSNGEIRWMEIQKYLREKSKGGKKVTKIEFQGERFDAVNIMKLRQYALTSLEARRSKFRAK